MLGIGGDPFGTETILALGFDRNFSEDETFGCGRKKPWTEERPVMWERSCRCRNFLWEDFRRVKGPACV